MPNQDPSQNQNPINPSAKPTSGVTPPTIFPQSDLPPLPPVFQNLQNNITPPGSDATSSPPIISTSASKPKKKFGGGKIIATILGLVVLLGGLATGIVLTQQKQLFQQKAANCDSATEFECTCPNGDNFCISGGATGGCNAACVGHGGNGGPSTDNPGHTMSCGSQTCHTDYEVCCSAGCKRIDAGGCIDSAKQCNSQGNTDEYCRGQNEGFTYCSCLPGSSAVGGCGNSEGKGFTRTCKTYESTGNNEYRCTNVVSGTVCDNPHASPTESPTHSPSPTSSATSSPTSSPTEIPSAPSCIAIKAYNTNWESLGSTDLSLKTSGNTVNFCVNGNALSGSFDKAYFKIGTTVESETTTKRPNSNDFCQIYTILPADTTVSVKAKIHHVPDGVWVGESF